MNFFKKIFGENHKNTEIQKEFPQKPTPQILKDTSVELFKQNPESYKALCQFIAGGWIIKSIENFEIKKLSLEKAIEKIKPLEKKPYSIIKTTYFNKKFPKRTCEIQIFISQSGLFKNTIITFKITLKSQNRSLYEKTEALKIISYQEKIEKYSNFYTNISEKTTEEILKELCYFASLQYQKDRASYTNHIKEIIASTNKSSHKDFYFEILKNPFTITSFREPKNKFFAINTGKSIIHIGGYGQELKIKELHERFIDAESFEKSLNYFNLALEPNPQNFSETIFKTKGYSMLNSNTIFLENKITSYHDLAKKISEEKL